MKSAAIDDKALLELCRRIKQLSSLTLTERRQVIEELLKAVDVVRIDNELLVCPLCAAGITGYKNRSGVYRILTRDLHTFKLCCRSYFDRRELEQVRVRPRSRKGEKTIKVGYRGD